MKVPIKERLRVKMLYASEALKADNEKVFSDVASLGAVVCKVPICAISFLDYDTQWFKGSVGITVCDMPRGQSFCAHAISAESVFIVPNVLTDQRFENHPLVTGPPYIQFYAGIPIFWQGQAIGAICIMDFQPRMIDEVKMRGIQTLSRLVTERLASRISLEQLVTVNVNIPAIIHTLVLDSNGIAYFSYISDSEKKILPLESDIFVEKEIKNILNFVPEDLPDFEQALRSSALGLKPLLWEGRIFDKTNRMVWIQIRSKPNRGNADTITFNGIIIDISERIALEKNLAEEKRRSSQSEKMAALGLMASQVAHEVRNPLTIITLLVSSLQDDAVINIAFPSLNESLAKIYDMIKRIVNSLEKINSRIRENSPER